MRASRRCRDRPKAYSTSQPGRYRPLKIVASRQELIDSNTSLVNSDAMFIIIEGNELVAFLDVLSLVPHGLDVLIYGWKE
jgi:hypothetical protein